MSASLYLIEILHQTTTSSKGVSCFSGCILSKFYIKPQLFSVPCRGISVVSYRNSTSNHNVFECDQARMLVVSYRNSTSNHNDVRTLNGVLHVVSYRNSTSNHNIEALIAYPDFVVSYRNSTSNHNNQSL